MSGRYTVLADETEYDGAECGYSEGVLWVYLPAEVNMTSAFMDFSNPEKTQAITFHYGDMSTEYTGFTDFRGIMKNLDGKMSVQLQRGAA